MIASLRRRHRIVMPILAVVLPVLFVAALIVRPTIPVMEQDPITADAGLGDTQAEARPVFEATLDEPPMALRLLADATAPSVLVVELRPLEPWSVPDVLVYWHAEPLEAAATALPAGAVLLGPAPGLDVRRFRLPRGATETSAGTITLYSLAHQAVVQSRLLDVP